MPDRTAIGDRFLFAADDLVDPLHNPSPVQTRTREFWEAFGEFGAEFLAGSFDMTTDTNTGRITVTFHPHP